MTGHLEKKINRKKCRGEVKANKRENKKQVENPEGRSVMGQRQPHFHPGCARGRKCWIIYKHYKVYSVHAQRDRPEDLDCWWKKNKSFS